MQPGANGPAACSIARALTVVGDRWLAGEEGAPLTHRPCGHAARPELTCGHCGDALRPEDVRAKLRLGVGSPSKIAGRKRPGPALSTST